MLVCVVIEPGAIKLLLESIKTPVLSKELPSTEFHLATAFTVEVFGPSIDPKDAILTKDIGSPKFAEEVLTKRNL